MATGSRLHLIEPLGFRLDEKSLRRAGMDYWKDLDVTTYINYEDFLQKNPGAKLYMATTKAEKMYTQIRYEPGFRRKSWCVTVRTVCGFP